MAKITRETFIYRGLKRRKREEARTYVDDRGNVRNDHIDILSVGVGS